MVHEVLDRLLVHALLVEQRHVLRRVDRDLAVDPLRDFKGMEFAGCGRDVHQGTAHYDEQQAGDHGQARIETSEHQSSLPLLRIASEFTRCGDQARGYTTA